jgi:diguanylate cyclase (GGDEF)-like protein
VKRKNYIKFYLLVLTGLAVVITGLYYLSNKIIQNETKEIKNIEVSHVESFAKNIRNRVLKLTKNNIIENTEHNPILRKKLNNMLSLFSNKRYRYVYMVYIDKKGLPRYLADGSQNISQRGEFKQRFVPVSDIWNKAVKSPKPVYTIQNKVTGLWLTYLYPVKYSPKEKVILVFDISIGEYDTLFSVIRPLQRILLATSVSLVLILLFSFFQAYLYFRQKDKSNIDPLTHLHNRRYLKQISTKLDLKQCAILMVDVDFFKKINDTYGHKTGDIVLESISKRLLSVTRTFDEVIRYGGEEFLIILNKQNSIRTTKEICQRILKTISSMPIRVGETNISVSVSIGVNPTPFRNNSLEDAIKSADEMLYEAKRTGRNRVVILNEKNEEDNILLLNQILKALKEGRLKAFFQPILDIKTGKIIEYEALARIIDEEGSMYLPAQFLPIIQQTPSYTELTKNILSQSFQMIKIHNVKVSINLNIDDFLNDTLFDLVEHIIKLNKEDADKLTIEIYENRYIDDFKTLSGRIRKLKLYGIKIAVDSFGNGSAGLDYIVNMKPDYIKIDGSIISKISSSKDIPPIVHDIVQICKSLKIKTIAEFVENKEILAILKNSGIDMAQGYYIGKPLNLLSRKWAPKVLFFE